VTITAVDTEEPRAPTRRRPRQGIGDTARAYLLNAPAMIVIGLLVAYPIAYSFWLSLHRYNLKLPALERFVWFQNYLSLISDPVFLSSLRVTVMFVVVVLGLTVILGTALALVLNETFLGRGVLRSLVLLPWAMPGVVNGCSSASSTPTRPG
jgi:multiple sugar transport system permease protein